jgi:hypothetical protein
MSNFEEMERIIMAKAYYSTVFQQTADQIWAAIRDFGNYSWFTKAHVEAFIEDGKPGDKIGTIRNVRIGDTRIRQRLLAHSDRNRYYTYGFCDPDALPVHHYEATLRVTPIIDRNRAFVEWWATFDCDNSEYERWTAFYANSFAQWLGSLRAHLPG